MQQPARCGAGRRVARSCCSQRAAWAYIFCAAKHAQRPSHTTTTQNRLRWRASSASHPPACGCSSPRWWWCAAGRARWQSRGRSRCPSAGTQGGGGCWAPQRVLAPGVEFTGLPTPHPTPTPPHAKHTYPPPLALKQGQGNLHFSPVSLSQPTYTYPPPHAIHPRRTAPTR